MAEYIERDKIHNCLDDLSSENLIGNDNDTFISLPKAHDKIDDIPPADVAELKHGEWKDRGNGDWSCTNCNEIFTLNVDMHPIHDCGLKFCPNCGADMRGEKNAE